MFESSIASAIPQRSKAASMTPTIRIEVRNLCFFNSGRAKTLPISRSLLQETWKPSELYSASFSNQIATAVAAKDVTHPHRR